VAFGHKTFGDQNVQSLPNGDLCCAELSSPTSFDNFLAWGELTAKNRFTELDR
jgi:hypothetical protein